MICITFETNTGKRITGKMETRPRIFCLHCGKGHKEGTNIKHEHDMLIRQYDEVIC